MREHAGLLVDRGGRQLGFIHLTFQEYLAAVAIAYRAQDGLHAVVEVLAAHVGESSWEEVTRLVIGEIGVQQERDKDASTVLECLLRDRPGPAGAMEVLVGRAVHDVWPGGVTSACRETVRKALVVALREDQRVEARQRAAAGAVLGELGDPRPEVTDVDAMQFCWVPAGPFRMGSGSKEKDSFGDEKPQHDVDLDDGYWIGRFPVTAAQYGQYAAEVGGAEEAHVWAPNAPVTAISWHRARRFCAWLMARWRVAGLIGDDWIARLPSEAEWEKAARGGLRIPERFGPHVVGTKPPTPTLIDNPLPGRAYPWGDTVSSELASYDETGIKSASAVGCFPGGTSPYGCEELSGNVWEWTRSLWGPDSVETEFPYPYQPGDEREHQEADDDVARVLRGGSYFDNAGDVRCAYRSGHSPAYRDESVGFRVVLSPFFSDL